MKIDAQMNEQTIVLREATLQLGKRMIWRDSSFSIKQGEFIAILGPNGSGKTSFLRVLVGLLPLTGGQVYVLGNIPRRGNKFIGYVPQRRMLDQDLHIRGHELVTLGITGTHWGFSSPREMRRERTVVQQALDSVGANHYAERPIGQMSGGEQQRLLLAQALIGSPRLLLLDEPLASLDLHNQEAITQLVAHLAARDRITVLLVTHDINPVLPVVDRVIYLTKGQMLIGTPDEVITAERLTELYGAPVQVLRDNKERYLCSGEVK